MDCFHNTDVLQQSENDLFALRIKKTAVCFFQSIYSHVFQLKNVPKKDLIPKNTLFYCYFLFSTLNIKSELFCCYLVCFLLLHKCFNRFYTLFVICLFNQVISGTHNRYDILMINILIFIFFLRISLGKLFVRSSGTLKIKYHLFKI